MMRSAQYRTTVIYLPDGTTIVVIESIIAASRGADRNLASPQDADGRAHS